MKFIILIFLMISGQAMASDCFSQVAKSFKEMNPKHFVKQIKYMGVLKPSEEKPYYQQEIWNDSKKSLDIYEVESSFMAKFVHVLLVDKESCQVKKSIEVFFE